MRNNAVTWYTSGRVSLPVYFPEDRAVCQWCPYVRTDEPVKRQRCVLTGELLVYPFTARGNECPVILEEDKDGEVPVTDRE